MPISDHTAFRLQHDRLKMRPNQTIIHSRPIQRKNPHTHTRKHYYANMIIYTINGAGPILGAGTGGELAAAYPTKLLEEQVIHLAPQFFL